MQSCFPTLIASPVGNQAALTGNLDTWRAGKSRRVNSSNDKGAASTNFYAAASVLGFTDDCQHDLAITSGAIRAAAPSRSGARRVDVSSLLEAGVTLAAIGYAEAEYRRINRENYKRRKAREAK